MEGTVICASRAEGLVARAGSAVNVAASGRGGMARGSAWEALVGTLDAPAFVLATAVLAIGLPLPAGAAFFAAEDLTGTLALEAGAFLAGILAAVLAIG